MDVWRMCCVEENNLLAYNFASLFTVLEKVRAICGFIGLNI